jgi:acetoin utilization protein AcuB
MQLQQIMTTHVVTVGLDENLKTVQELFMLSRFHHLLVLDEDGALVGVVSDRDLLKALSPFISTLAERPQDLRTLKKRVHQIMSRRPITASKNDTIRQAAILMLNNNISCLPVVSPQRTIEGIVTWKDVFRCLAKQLQE